MTVTILDIETGLKHKSTLDMSSDWWATGNGSCDCNRCHDLPEIEAALDEQYDGGCFGERRFLIVATAPISTTEQLRTLNQDYPLTILNKYLPL